MNKKLILVCLNIFVIIILLCSSSMAFPGVNFKNNIGQSAKGLKLTLSSNLTVDDVEGSILPFTQKTALPPDGIWLSGGTLAAGESTGCMYFLGRNVTNASWTNASKDTVLGDALASKHACETIPMPSLTQFGIIILIALIIVSGVYLWMRRRPVAT